MRIKSKLMSTSLIASAALIAMPAFAQTQPAPSDDEDAQVSDQTADSDAGSPIIVTGSRIRQDSFNSPSPIQVLDAEQAAKLGVSSAAELLQRAPVASGAQIDSQLNTSSGNSNATEAPPTGGTGSSNIDLRGLSPERTLVLINGRRLGSAGVRGAPSQPDISLLPLSMIERVDIVTEGASSIYGADAVAGVVNVILKNNFQGLEITGGIQSPEHGGGQIERFGATFGVAGERGNIMVGAEYYNRGTIQVSQRSFTAPGARSIEVDENGNIQTIFIDGNFDNAILLDGSSFIFYTPGTSIGTGVDDFSDYRGLPELPANARDFGSSTNFIYFPYYGDSDDNNDADLVQPLERISFVTNGSYELIPSANVEAYFEGYYFERRQFIRSVNEQIFPDIPALIPVLDENGTEVDRVDNPLNPFDVNAAPIITLDDLPQEFTVNVQQIRAVGGIRGDIPGGFFEERNWGFDVSWSYDQGDGFVSQPVLAEQQLLAATQGVYIDEASGELRCGLTDRIQQGGFFSLSECTPVNFFNPVFYVGGENGEGAFENQAQRDYLTGNRTNRTVIEQTIYAAYLNGGLFDIPFGGEVAVALGYEHRDDSIDSQNSFLGINGDNASENPVAEGETVGRRNLDEVFGEIQIPLIQDRPFFELLQFDAAARYTDESNFGGETTYRIRGLWRPVSWVQISGSYGTSYRAPNLREQFLASQGGGIGGNLDPCIAANFVNVEDFSAPGTVNTISNCVAAGVVFTDELDENGDPGTDGFLDTTLLGSTGITTIPTSTGGNADLLPETSDSFTATFSVSPPISNAFDIDLAVSYYKIDIENSVRNLGAATIISRCYSDLNFPNLSSPFCDRVERRSTGSEEQRLISQVTAGFVNIGEDMVEGLDFNVRLRTNFQDLFGGPDADFFIAASASRLLARETQADADDPSTRQELEGTFGLDASGLPFSFPEWKGQLTAGIDFGRLEILTQLNYIGEQQFVNAAALVTNANPFIVDGNGVRIQSRNFGTDIDAQIYQSLSIGYDASDRVNFVVGVNNLWDKEPPLVDRSISPQRQNALTSSGYDFVGRTFFVNANIKL